jgi:hypothetical protein
MVKIAKHVALSQPANAIEAFILVPCSELALRTLIHVLSLFRAEVVQSI